MELRRAASGLVKVICRTEESRPNGRGKKRGKPKQKGLLASFEEWFGSINMMNILYVWFPASWGPSVVEAIQTRNVICLAKKPIVCSQGGGCGGQEACVQQGEVDPRGSRGSLNLWYSAGVTLKTPVPNEP